MHKNLQPAYIVNRHGYTARCLMEHNRIEIYNNKTCETHILMVRHYESTLQLERASRRNTEISCFEKMCLYKLNGLRTRAKYVRQASNPFLPVVNKLERHALLANRRWFEFIAQPTDY